MVRARELFAAGEHPSATAAATQSGKLHALEQSFYTQTPSGSHITVDFTGEGPAEVETLREQLGIDPVSHATVNIDNRDGSDDVGVYKVVFYDEDGNSYEFEDLSTDHIAEWGPSCTDSYGGVEGEYGHVLNDGTTLKEAPGDALSNQAAELHNQYLNGPNASRHEKTEGWIASTSTQLPETITAIEVWPGGIVEDPIDMVPAGEKDSYEVPAATEPVAPRSDEDAEAELQEWKDAGADCADDVLAGLGPQTWIAAAAECSFGQETTEGTVEGTPDVAEQDGVGIPVRTELPIPGAMPDQNFTYEQAYAARESGMPYYDAFCLDDEPVTAGGVSQCEGTEAGTVDKITGECIGG